MEIAVRSRLNMGIAVASVGAIAFAPIAQPMPAIAELQARAVSSTEVALTAAVNPIEQWSKIIQDALANGGTLVQSYLDNPVPILHQLLLNGLGYGRQTFTALQTSVVNLVDQLRLDNPNGFPAGVKNGLSQILAGEIYEGTTTLFNAGLGFILGPVGPLLELLQIPVTMAQNFANVVAAVPGVLLGVGFGAIATVNGTIQATSFQAQAVLDALKVGDLMGAAGALVATPGAIVNAVLNGFALTGAPGLLSPGGLIAQVIQGLNTIAQALAPAPPLAAKVADTGPSALPSTASSLATVTLGTEKPATADAAKTSATEPKSPEASPTEPRSTEPTATVPAATEPTATEPEKPSSATESKPESKPEPKPEPGTPSSTTTPNGGTDMTSGNKAEPGKTGAPTKPSGSTDGGTGSGSTGAGSTGSQSSGSDSGSAAAGTEASGSGSGATGSGSGASGSAASGAAA
ncbi:hypothetical protein ACXPWS_31535 [Mycobacterium sp. BMJ-28]